ncbi:unnamed protein product, partial [Acidithrix sp. C25]
VKVEDAGAVGQIIVMIIVEKDLATEVTAVPEGLDVDSVAVLAQVLGQALAPVLDQDGVQRLVEVMCDLVF